MERGSGEPAGRLGPSVSNPSINTTTVARTDQRMRSSSAAVKTASDEENVRVIVRIRPLSKVEEEKGCRDIVSVDRTENSITVHNPVPEGGTPKSFRFDAVFATDSTQAELFNQVARPIIQNVIEGYNGTVFAYGQTGTGKTFTMEGDRSVPELKGIIPNSFAQIFSHIAQESDNSKFLVRVSYLEIYNEDVRDLLGKDAQKKLEVKERSETGVYVKNLSSFVVRNESDMEKILKIGNKNRVVGSTNMNVESSRSHAIFAINVECSTEIGGERSLRMGKLNLVDLAGSERVSKTGASGHRLKEGAKINLSLSCLGNVIAALVEGQAHIPYRSSKLTRLLQDSLGGNSKTVMIANIGPADYNYDETISTLRYADRAKQIKNHAHINEDPKDALLRQFEKEIEELRLQLEQGELENAESKNKLQDDEEELPAEEVSSLLVPDEETLIGIKGEIETQQRLSSAVQTEAESKQSALYALKQNVLNWKQHQEKKSSLEEKLKSIQKKIMVGGENLLDKSQEQEAFLQNSMKELQERRKEQIKLQTSLSSKMAEKAVYEENILRLQAESQEMKRELRKAMRTLEKEALEDQTAIEEEEAEKDALVNEIEHIRQEVKKSNITLEQYIPPEILKAIKESMTYNEDTGSWDIPCIAYAGNHVDHAQSRRRPPRNRGRKVNVECLYKSIEKTNGSHEFVGDEAATKSFLKSPPARTKSALTKEERKKLHEEYEKNSSKFLDFTEVEDFSSGEEIPSKL